MRRKKSPVKRTAEHGTDPLFLHGQTGVVGSAMGRGNEAPAKKKAKYSTPLPSVPEDAEAQRRIVQAVNQSGDVDEGVDVDGIISDSDDGDDGIISDSDDGDDGNEILDGNGIFDAEQEEEEISDDVLSKVSM